METILMAQVWIADLTEIKTLFGANIRADMTYDEAMVDVGANNSTT